MTPLEMVYVGSPLLWISSSILIRKNDRGTPPYPHSPDMQCMRAFAFMHTDTYMLYVTNGVRRLFGGFWVWEHTNKRASTNYGLNYCGVEIMWICVYLYSLLWNYWRCLRHRIYSCCAFVIQERGFHSPANICLHDLQGIQGQGQGQVLLMS